LCKCIDIVVGLSSSDLNHEYFGRRFNQQPVAIFDIPEPSNTGKALKEFFVDMKSLATQGIRLSDPTGDESWIHKAFLKGHLADAVAR
jgi:hypothetical protein